MSQLLAPYNSAMRIGQGFNSYTQQICLDQAVTIDPEWRLITPIARVIEGSGTSKNETGDPKDKPSQSGEPSGNLSSSKKENDNKGKPASASGRAQGLPNPKPASGVKSIEGPEEAGDIGDRQEAGGVEDTKGDTSDAAVPDGTEVAAGPEKVEGNGL